METHSDSRDCPHHWTHHARRLVFAYKASPTQPEKEMTGHISLHSQGRQATATPLTPFLGKIGTRRRHGAAEKGYPADREQSD